MKNLSAFILKIDTFDDFLADMTIDTTIEGFVRRSLRSESGWNAMIDNENKTFIFFVNYENESEMHKMIEDLNKIPTDTKSILVFEDITHELLHASTYDNYKKTCERTQEFVKENLDIDFVLEKITTEGMDSLLPVELSILKA